VRLSRSDASTLSPFRLTKPCATCPFRMDIVPFLHPARIDELQEGLVEGTFSCHKTVDYSSCPEDDDGARLLDRRNTQDEVHCAGALILLEKLEQPSQMMRIAERLGIYDRTKLDMRAPVYDSFEEMKEAAMLARAPAKKRGRRRR